MKNSEYRIGTVTSNKIKLISFFGTIALIFVHNESDINGEMTPSMIVSTSFGWSDVVQNFILNGLLRFRLPFMMIISVFFMFYRPKHSYLLHIKSKFRTIGFPYLLISLSGLFITFLFETFFVPQNSVYAFSGMIGKKIIDLSLTEFISYVIKSPIVFQLWYLRVLFIFVLFMPFIKYLITKIPVLFLGTVLMVWLFTNRIGGGENDRGYLFFFFGAYLAINKINTSKEFSFFSAKSSLAIFIILAVFKTFLTFYGSHLFGSYAHFSVSFLYKLNEIFGLYAVWFVFDSILLRLMDQQLWMRITESSFFIYAFHAPLIVFINKILKLSNNIFSTNAMLSFFLIPVMVLLITLMLEDTIKRISQKFYSLLTGGRSKAPPFNFDIGIIKLPQLSFTGKFVLVSSLGSFIIIAAGAMVFFK